MFKSRAKAATRVAVLVAVLAASLLAGPVKSATAADDVPTAPLPPGFSAIVTDPLTNRVFVSSALSNVVSVFGESGDPEGSLAVPGASDMVVHEGRLYVAAKAAGVIDAYDTTSLNAVATLGSGLTQPRALAWAGDELWTSTLCDDGWHGCLAAVDPVTGETTVEPMLAHPMDDSRLTSSPTDPNAMVECARTTSGSWFVRLDVSTGVPVEQASALTDLAGCRQVAFVPDGTRVLAAGGAPYVVEELSFDTLQPTGRTYPTDAYPTGVAVDAASGKVVALRDAPYDPDVYVYLLDNSTPSWTYDFGQYGTTVDGGAAWHAGGTTLYVVSYANLDHDDHNIRLNLLTEPGTVQATSTTVSGATSATVGQAVTLTANVASTTTGTTPAWGTVTFTENNATLGVASISHGQATFVTQPGPGRHQITASFPGNQALAPSTSQPFTVDVINGTVQVALTASPAKTLPTEPVTLDVTVTSPYFSYSPSAPSGTVTLYDGGLAVGTATLVSSGWMSSRATLTTYAILPGTHLYTARYSGDTWYQPGVSAPVEHHVLI